MFKLSQYSPIYGSRQPVALAMDKPFMGKAMQDDSLACKVGLIHPKWREILQPPDHHKVNSGALDIPPILLAILLFMDIICLTSYSLSNT